MPLKKQVHSKSAAWCFTINNFFPDDVLRLRRLFGHGLATYVHFGRETGESGTRHLQGYLELPSRQRLTAVKKLCGAKAHLEPRRGTQQEADEYCSKDGDDESFGKLNSSQQGRRRDLEEIRVSIAAGASDEAIATDSFGQWCLHRRSFDAYRALINPPRQRDLLKVYVLWGPTGTGKTRFAMSRGTPWLSGDPSLQWFDATPEKILPSWTTTMEEDLPASSYASWTGMLSKSPLRGGLSHGTQLPSTLPATSLQTNGIWTFKSPLGGGSTEFST